MDHPLLAASIAAFQKLVHRCSRSHCRLRHSRNDCPTPPRLWHEDCRDVMAPPPRVTRAMCGAMTLSKVLESVNFDNFVKDR
jgi:hypothetical protein